MAWLCNPHSRGIGVHADSCVFLDIQSFVSKSFPSMWPLGPQKNSGVAFIAPRHQAVSVGARLRDVPATMGVVSAPPCVLSIFARTGQGLATGFIFD